MRRKEISICAVSKEGRKKHRAIVDFGKSLCEFNMFKTTPRIRDKNVSPLSIGLMLQKHIIKKWKNFNVDKSSLNKFKSKF